MRRGGGREKGNGFERLVAKRIVAVSCMTAKDCYRTPLSGGHPYGDRGDLVVSPQLRKRFPFFVECKFYRGWNLDHLLWPGSLAKSWYKKLVQQSKEARLIPMFVAKGNRGVPIAAVPIKVVKTFPVLKSVSPFLKYKIQGESWIATTLDEFLAAVFKD